MKIFIDADGCPVVNISISIGKKYNLPVIVVKNYAVEIKDDYAEIVSVDISRDSADFYIVNRIKEGDIVITQDYGLAAMCLSKKAIPINQNGFIFDEYNIDYMLNRRHIHSEMRRQHKKHSNPPKRKKVQDTTFEESFEELIKSKI